MELFLLILCFGNFMAKLSWGMQNFLTMEFYRIICNKCYWNNVYEKEHSFIKNTALIFISILPALFMSFFYLPTDPANSAKASSILRSLKLLYHIRLKFGAIVDSLTDKVINLPSFVFRQGKINSPNEDFLSLFSVLRI